MKFKMSYLGEKLQSLKYFHFFLTLITRCHFSKSIIIQTLNVPWGLAEFGCWGSFSSSRSTRKIKTSSFFPATDVPLGNSWGHPSPFPGRQLIRDSCSQDLFCLLVASACARHERTIRHNRGYREDPPPFTWNHQPWLWGRTNSCHERTNLLLGTVSDMQTSSPADTSAQNRLWCPDLSELRNVFCFGELWWLLFCQET